MPTIPRRHAVRLLFAALVLVTGGSAPSAEAAAPASCWAAAVLASLRPVERIATCDQCRTSGPRAGYKRCCEQVGGDYVCKWVRC